METARTKIIAGLHVLFALLVLLINSVAPVVKLMSPAPVTCGMACCEASGVCYCEAHHPGRSEATGASAHADIQADKLAAAIISPSCPAKCAQLPAGFQQKISMIKARISQCVLSVSLTQLLYARRPRFARDTLLIASSAPRSPPPSC
jgi:hypothetical protein